MPLCSEKPLAKLKLKSRAPHKYVIISPLGSHSEDKTNECGMEGDQRKDGKADQVGLVPS